MKKAGQLRMYNLLGLKRPICSPSNVEMHQDVSQDQYLKSLGEGAV